MQLALVIDLDRCIGCLGGCRVACKNEHGIALGASRSKMYTVESGAFPDLQMYFMPVMCQQCDNPSCVKVCPTGACYKDLSDGVIKIDKTRCVGCESCKRGCPYSAVNLNQEMRLMDKCDVCSDLRSEGGTPACAKNCSGHAIYFGDVSDPESEISLLLKNASADHIHALRDVGNRPSGRFILRHSSWKEDVL